MKTVRFWSGFLKQEYPRKNFVQPNYAPEVPKEFVEKYRNLDSIYCTVDFAELDDSTWKVVETGDGSVQV